ncbi:unnamed protein product [Polarella glacialis]|uniref:Ubiquitin-like domain-containing protein n=1 Tax=Polarella glacialis TaxID=89957 RepID=A0A813IR06_POLGL|nr:unnamed protein product [Polarella glacialis]
MASSQPVQLRLPSGEALELVPGATTAEEVKELRSRVAAALGTFHGSIMLILGQAQLEDEDSLVRVDSEVAEDGTAVTVMVVQLACALVGEYSASESGPGMSWGSFTYTLKIEADGNASFYTQSVADRDTDSTFTSKGHCSVAGGIVTFHAQEKTGKHNYASEETSASSGQSRFLMNADGNLQQLCHGSDTEIMIYTIGYGEGDFPSLLVKQK